MCSMLSFLAYAKAQQRILKRLNGIIMYPQTESGIPEYVHFMPKELKHGKCLSSCLKHRISCLSDHFYILYFNPIRWILPDLSHTMKSLHAVPVQYGKHQLNFMLSYGRITFDVTPQDLSDDEDESPQSRVPLFIYDSNLYISVMELPGRMGSPKLFEKIDFKW